MYVTFSTLSLTVSRHLGRFPFTKKFYWEFPLGKARSICHKSHYREAWPLKRPRKAWNWWLDRKSVNGTQIFHWEVSIGKAGLPFREFRLFRKISSGKNQKVVFHLQPDRNFRNFLVNGKHSFLPILLIQTNQVTSINHVVIQQTYSSCIKSILLKIIIIITLLMCQSF